MKLWTRREGGWEITAYSFEPIDSRMYLIRRGSRALIIDPHADEALSAQLEGVEDLRVYLTHEHFDHISGVNWLRARTNAVVYAGDSCARHISAPRNGTSLFPLLFIQEKEVYRKIRQTYSFPYVCRADAVVSDADTQNEDGLRLEILLTPGHSPGGISILMNRGILFGGDTLLGNGQELRSADADREDYCRSLRRLAELSRQYPGLMVFPGHGEPQPLQNLLNQIEDYCPWN